MLTYGPDPWHTALLAVQVLQTRARFPVLVGMVLTVGVHHVTTN